MNSKKKRNQKKSANPETLTLVPQSVESVERETRSKRKEEGFGLEKSQSRTLNPRRSSGEEEQCKSPNPNSPHQFRKEKNNSNPKGKKKRKRMERDLAVHGANPSPAREKRAEPGGDVSAKLDQGGAAAKAARRWRAHPLGSTRVGEGAGNGAMAAARSLCPPFCRSSHSVAAGCAEVERGESGEEEREAESANGLGFPVGGRGFVHAKSTRSRRSPSDGRD